MCIKYIISSILEYKDIKYANLKNNLKKIRKGDIE